jgi:hypothetical protein
VASTSGQKKTHKAIKAETCTIDKVNEVTKGAEVHRGRLRGGEVVDWGTFFLLDSWTCTRQLEIGNQPQHISTPSGAV